MRQRLSERLSAVNGAKAGYPPAFRIFMDDYFYALSRMCGSEYYSSLYNGYLKKFDCWNGKFQPLVAVIPATLHNNKIAQKDQMELLHRILVEPFADSTIWEKKGEK